MSEKTTQPPLMARVGRRYFESRSARTKAVNSGDALHVLNPEERRALRKVELGAVAQAAFAGAMSGGMCAAAEVIGTHEWPDDAVARYALMGAVTVIAAICEIAFVYWLTLSSVHELARVAGLELFGKDRASSDEALIDALARAALELPNPVDKKAGVNPHRETRKWQLVLVSLAYKAKIGVTNFLAKMLIRRLMGRVALRGLLPFVALPVSAFWNGVVMWLVLREARIRAMGPSAIDELVKVIFDDAPELSEKGRLSAVRAVASAIVRTQDLHPNLVRLLTAVASRTGDTGTNELDDVSLFLENLKALDAVELKVSVQLIAVACIVDGKLSGREKKLWSDAMSAVGRSVEYDGLKRLLKGFVSGDELADGSLRGL